MSNSHQTSPVKIANKSARLETRITPDQKNLLRKAAEIRGKTLSDFVLDTLLEAANRTIQENEFMILSGKEKEQFVESLLNPPAPSSELQAAVRRYNQMFPN